MENFITVESGDILFLLIGAVMIFSMHAGFAFLEVGSVRKKNQVNALNKIIFDWAISTVIYFVIGFPIAYGVKNFTFWQGANSLMADGSFDMIRFFLLLGFAACIPAIISGGVAERVKFWSNSIAGAIFVGLVYPFVESAIWGQLNWFGAGSWLESLTGTPLQDYAGSIVVHSLGGWLALPAIMLLGARKGKFNTDGSSNDIPVSNIPFLALGSWILCVGWFGFNVMSAQSLGGINAIVAINSLMAMVGGILSGTIFSKNDSGSTHNGALAGLVAVCAGSNLYHPVASLVIGFIAGLIFIYGFNFTVEKLKLDDVLGVWALHGLCGTWGGLAVGIFGLEIFGGAGGVNFLSQLIGSLFVIVVALVASYLVYLSIKSSLGIRISDKEEELGADLSIHNSSAYPEDNVHTSEELEEIKVVS